MDMTKIIGKRTIPTLDLAALIAALPADVELHLGAAVYSKASLLAALGTGEPKPAARKRGRPTKAATAPVS